ncbi:MAG: 5'-3' exonuclease H3TH domain-containing protein [Spirochaetia bacterium]
MQDALYLLDGYSLVYRSYFALIRRPMFNPKGKNSSAIYGFFRSLLLLLGDRMPTHFAVALDSTTPTFRHEKYPAYKATREKTPEDLRDEIPVIEEILRQLGVPAIRVNGFEADDVMATLALQSKAEGRACYIITGDKDLLQLVDGPVRVLKPESGGGFTEMDRGGVIEAWGVKPEQILDYLSLVGDTSDNVPGVKGIGAKTAAALLSVHPTLQDIYANLDSIKSESQRKKLADGRENAFLSQELITLETAVPLEVRPGDLMLPPLNGAAAAPFFAAEGMKSIVKELTGSEEHGRDASDPLVILAAKAALRQLSGAVTSRSATLDPSGGVDPGEGETITAASAVSRPAHHTYVRDPHDCAAGEYELVTDLDALDRWCVRIQETGLVSFDSETTSLDAMSAEPVGFSFSTERGNGCYIALHGPDGPVLPADEARDRLRSILENPEVAVIGQNLKYDYKVLKRWGVAIANPFFRQSPDFHSRRAHFAR